MHGYIVNVNLVGKKPEEYITHNPAIDFSEHRARTLHL
jgi:hypothetical protein